MLFQGPSYSVSTSHVTVCGFVPRLGHIKDHLNKLSTYSVLRKVLKKL